MQQFNKKPPHAIGAIFARSSGKRAVDPVEITIVSEKSDKVLEGIKNKVQRTATTQLDSSIPGIIVCFLEGIDDLAELSRDSGLQIISSYLLQKDELSHIAAVMYCAEPRFHISGNVRTFDNQGLIFRNVKCKYTDARDYEFLTAEYM